MRDDENNKAETNATDRSETRMDKIRVSAEMIAAGVSARQKWEDSGDYHVENLVSMIFRAMISRSDLVSRQER